MTLPTELRPHLPQTCYYTHLPQAVNRFYSGFLPACSGVEKWWRGEDSNLRRRRQQIYSLPPLAARVPLHFHDWSRREELNLQPSDYKSDALPLSYVGTHLVQRLANTLAFERRCIRSSFVAQVRRTLPVRLHLRALLARRINALDAQVICETLHYRK